MRFDPKSFKKKSACVIGLGRSGRACAKLLVAKGFKVFGSDKAPRAELRKSLGALAARIAYEGGGHSDKALKCGFAVKSPGMHPHLPIFDKLKKAGIPVFSELEVALAFCKAKVIVAVTGTNGKTTTTAMAGNIFAAANRRARVCGNIGTPVSEVAAQAAPSDVIVLEASSYQLEDSQFFHPTAAALLNVTADHIDHHGTMAKYVAAKAKMFAQMTATDTAVFNADDPLCLKVARDCKARKYFFGSLGSGRVHAWTDGKSIFVRLRGEKIRRFKSPKLAGRHNLDNAMAAVLLSLARGVKPAAIQKALNAFKGVEHRLEEVGIVNGLRCVNDSKATNVDSTLVALRAFPQAASTKNIFLILGGLHKGAPYTPLRAPIETVVKAVLTIGSAARKIEEDLGGVTTIFPCGDLRTAVETAFKVASKGDVLLLSPACASFDQFKDFEDRGRMFKTFLKEFR